MAAFDILEGGRKWQMRVGSSPLTTAIIPMRCSFGSAATETPS